MFTQQSASQTSQLQFSLDCSRNPPMSSAEGSGSMQTQTAFTRCIIEPYFIEQTTMPEDAQHVRNNSLLTHNNSWVHNTYDKIKQTTQLSTMCKPNYYKASLPHCYSNKYPQKTLFLTSSQRCNGVQLCFPWAFCNECPGRGRPCQATSLLLCTVMWTRLSSNPGSQHPFPPIWRPGQMQAKILAKSPEIHSWHKAAEGKHWGNNFLQSKI